MVFRLVRRGGSGGVRLGDAPLSKKRAGLQDAASHNSKHSPRSLISPSDCANIVRHAMPAGELTIFGEALFWMVCALVHICVTKCLCTRVSQTVASASVCVSPSHALRYICIPLISEAHVH